MLRPFITVLEWAAVLVIIFYPVHKRLGKLVRRPGLNALLSCLLVIIVVVLPLVLVTMALTNELARVGSDLPAHLAQLTNPDSSALGRAFRWVQNRIPIGREGTQEFFVEQLKTAGTLVLGQSVGLVGNIVGTIVKSFFVVITMYYLFRDGDKILRAIPGALPLSREQSKVIFARISEVVHASVYGVVSIALLQGCLGGLAFWALGVPSPILWGMLLALVCMIPVAGSFFIWLPASIFLMLTGHWTRGILLILWGALVISTIDNFLRPKLIKNQTRLHELFVFFSVLGGMSVFGLLGIVLGPVVLAVTLGLLQTFRHQDDGVDERGAARLA
jgi:predicted PurR-regulated permease PerM